MRRENRKRQHDGHGFLMIAPMYLFTLFFVFAPLCYMVILSFLTRAEVWGVVHEVTLDNYRNIMTPVYLRTFYESLKLAGICVVLIILTGYPFGYFMAKLSSVWKRRAFDDTVLDPCSDSHVWLDHYFSQQWCFG